jgi:hypothetical protein
MIRTRSNLSRLSWPIVRVVESGTPAASLLARCPVRVLYVQANPSGTEPLDMDASERALREGLGKTGEIRSVRATTPEAWRDMLRESPGFHGLHYDGHGIFDEEGGTGYLYLHDQRDGVYRLSGEMLATYLDGTAVLFAVLPACETAMDSK